MKPSQDDKNWKWVLLVAFVALIGPMAAVIKQEKPASVPDAPVVQKTDDFPRRFADASEFARARYGAKTLAYDPSLGIRQRVMQLVVPGDVSVYTARKIAQETFSALSTENAMVTVSDNTGRQRAFATKEGVFD